MQKKLDVVVIGELNIDLVLWRVPMPENEKEQLAEDMRFAMGSSSAITAHNLSAIGAKVGFIGKAGNDTFGKYMIDALATGGVDTSQIIVDDSLKTGATIVLANPPKKALLTYLGAMTQLTIDDLPWDYIATAKHLHVGCFFLQTGLRKDVHKIFARAKALGLSTSLDTNWDPDEQWGDDLHAALKETDIFLPNDDELLQITKKQTIAEAVEAFPASVKVLAVKLGKDGATVRALGNSFAHPGFSVESVETTGAGDSFNAGFLYRYLNGDDWASCLKFGNACGAVAVTEMGGTGAFADREALAKKLKSLLGEV